MTKDTQSSMHNESPSGEQPSSQKGNKRNWPTDPFKDFFEDSEVVEEVTHNGETERRRGIYLLPNLFTTGALFAGFFAVVSAVKGDFSTAAIAIFVSMVLDGCDGRVARMTNTQSAFGAEYDSLADMLSFAVAPAVLAFSWSLHSLGKFGWICAFVFVAGGALRLARFNVQLAQTDKKWFVGLPSPSAAAIVASCVWSFHNFEVHSQMLDFLIGILVALGGILMVSNIRYYSFKEVDFRGRVPFVALLVVVLAFVVISIQPSVVLLILFGGYALSGMIVALIRGTRLRAKQRKRRERN